MTQKIYNFNPGPAIMPDEVLKKISDEFFNFENSGMPILGISHRSKEFIELNNSAMNLMRELLGLDDSYEVIFMGGGASTQFALIPMNFLRHGKILAYVDTGAWSAKAIKDAQQAGQCQIVASSKDKNYNYIPDLSELEIPENCAYLHLTSNNTIFGTQIHNFPKQVKAPVICDMSSDIASRKIDHRQFSMIYAGAQKNLGAAGVTIAIIKKDFLETAIDELPIMFKYKTHAEKDSLYNTPPVFSIYTVKLVLEWIKNLGGLGAIEKINQEKQAIIYSLIDSDPEYFGGTAEKNSRSWMNITLRLPNEELEKKFISESNSAGLVGLKGHRSVGGIRISIYNALPLSAVEKMAEFMKEFKNKN